MGELVDLSRSGFSLVPDPANDAGSEMDERSWPPGADHAPRLLESDGGAASSFQGVDDRAKYLLQLLKCADSQLEPADLLYLLLSRLAPGDAAARCSATLLQRFGSLGKLLAAPWPKLETVSVEGLAGILKTIQAITVNVLREPHLDRPLIGDAKDLHKYLMVRCGQSINEVTRVLFLDAKYFLITDELHGQGTLDHTPLYTREVVRRVLDLGAKYVILVHNHPTGDANPSEADLKMTERLADALRGVEAGLLDHVIVTATKAMSFRKAGLLP